MAQSGKAKKISRKMSGEMPRLLAGLQPSQGFSLHLVICDAKAVIKKKLKELGEALAERLETVDLAKATDAVALLLEQVSRVPAGKIIAVTGLEKHISPSEKEYDPHFLPALNLKLFDLRRLDIPIVLILPIHQFEALKEEAPDIWEWRNGLYLFEERDEDRFQTAAFLCDHFMGSNNSESYLQKQTLLALYEALKFEYDSAAREGLLNEFNLLGKIGCLYYKLGNYRSAFNYFRKQLDFMEIAGDEDLYPPVLNNIGMVYAALSNYGEALDYLQRALKIGERTLRGDNHPNKAIMLSNIGEISFYLGDMQEAFLSCRQALRMAEKRLGMRHPTLIPIILKLAMVFREQGNYEDALDHYRRALHLVEKQFDIEHPYLAMVLQNIGMTYFHQKKYEMARRYIYRTLEISERALGAEHPYIAIMLNHVGVAHYYGSHYDWALKYFFWAMDIRAKSIGPQDLLIGTIYSNIGKVYHDRGNFPEAQVYFRKAHDIYRLQLPEDHPDTRSLEQFIFRVEEMLEQDAESNTQGV